MGELKIKQASERRELTNRLEDLELAHNLEAAKVEEALWDNFAREDPGFITLDEVGANRESQLPTGWDCAKGNGMRCFVFCYYATEST